MKGIILNAVSALALSATAVLADGSITVYTAAPQNFIDALVPVFEKASGTKVEIIKAGSGELLNRLTAEKGKPQADVLWSVDGTVVDFNPDLFDAYTAKDSDKLAETVKHSELWTPFTAVVTSFIVNEEKLDGKPVPTSWEALADPQYKGLISSARVDNSGSAYITMALIMQIFGDEKGMEIYKAQLANYSLSESSGAVSRFVNDGELPIGITNEDGALRYVEGGGPVRIIYPSEGTAIAPDAMALIKGGPNAEHGKAFIDFMLSQEGQTIVAEQGRRPVRADVASKPALTPMGEFKSANYDAKAAAAKREELVAAWKEMLLDVQ